MADFDKAHLHTSVDRNGIAWIVHPGPPCILWQLVEVDSSGKLLRASSNPPEDQIFDIIIKAGVTHWKLAVQFCGDGVPPEMTLEVTCEIAAVGINAVSVCYPDAFDARI